MSEYALLIPGLFLLFLGFLAIGAILLRKKLHANDHANHKRA